MDELDFREQADAHGFIIFAPDLNGGPLRSWLYHQQVIRLEDLIHRLTESYCLDPSKRLYLGHASSGLFAHALAGDGAAFATASFRPNEIEPLTPGTPQLIMTGMLDCVEPPDGVSTCVEGRHRWPLDRLENYARDAHACSGERTRWGEHADGECFTWDCEIPLVSCHVQGGRHWTPHPDDRELAPSAFPYAATIWQFFADQLKRQESASPDP